MKGWKARPLVMLTVVVALLLAISLPATANHVNPGGGNDRVGPDGPVGPERQGGSGGPVDFGAQGPVDFGPGGPANISPGPSTPPPNRCTRPFALSTPELDVCSERPFTVGDPQNAWNAGFGDGSDGGSGGWPAGDPTADGSGWPEFDGRLAWMNDWFAAE